MRRSRLIAEVESLEVLAVKKFWRAHLGMGRSSSGLLRRQRGRPLWFLLRNSPSRMCASLLSACWRRDADSMAASWYERVPTRNNCADGPSRLRFENIPVVGGRRVVVVAGPSLDLSWNRGGLRGAGGRCGEPTSSLALRRGVLPPWSREKTARHEPEVTSARTQALCIQRILRLV